MKRAPSLDLQAVLADLLQAAPTGAEGPAGADPVLDATNTLLNERGMRGWSVEDVAERAGVGRATVYRRFASRDDLVRAAISREARRFFSAVAQSVRAAGPLEDRVVHGFLAGLRMVQRSPLAALLRSDPAAALSVLTAEPLLRAAATALADRYQAMLPTRLDKAARAEAEAVAEGLVRLGVSFFLIPGQAGGELDPDGPALVHLRRVIRPLLAGRSSPPRSAPRRPAPR